MSSLKLSASPRIDFATSSSSVHVMRSAEGLFLLYLDARRVRRVGPGCAESGRMAAELSIPPQIVSHTICCTYKHILGFGRLRRLLARSRGLAYNSGNSSP